MKGLEGEDRNSETARCGVAGGEAELGSGPGHREWEEGCNRERELARRRTTDRSSGGHSRPPCGVSPAPVQLCSDIPAPPPPAARPRSHLGQGCTLNLLGPRSGCRARSIPPEPARRAVRSPEQQGPPLWGTFGFFNTPTGLVHERPPEMPGREALGTELACSATQLVPSVAPAVPPAETPSPGLPQGGLPHTPREPPFSKGQ